MQPVLQFIAGEEGETDLFSCGTVAGDWALCAAGCRLGDAALAVPAFCINTVRNDCPGNGHFDALMRQLLHHCDSHGYALVFLNVLHPFHAQLSRRGLTPLPGTAHLFRPPS